MSKMRKNVKASVRHMVRYQTLLILNRVQQSQAYSNLMIKEAEVADKDRGLLAEIVYGTISYRYYLDYQMDEFVRGKKMDAWVRELLRLSLYQMIFLDRIPDHAVIHDAVTIAKQAGNEGVGKFVNGILRAFQRRGHIAVQTEDALTTVSIETSMPKELLQFLSDQYGFDTTKALAYSLLTPSHVSARLTHLDESRPALLKELIAEGYEVKESQVSPYGIIGGHGFLAGSTPFKEGRLTIQDESSMLVAPALQVEPHHHVLDACAAPGGKTTHIASYLDANQGGKVTALDIHPHKKRLIEENAKRMHVEDVVEARVMDAREVQSEFDNESFDRILVDAPCSGLGLMRRKPDIKYTKTVEDLERLPQIQLEILESCASKLKNHGILLYSTCTINKKENEAVIEAFLANHPEFQVTTVKGSEQIEKSVHHQMVTLLPQDYYTDGFFICCLVKEEG